MDRKQGLFLGGLTLGLTLLGIGVTTQKLVFTPTSIGFFAAAALVFVLTFYVTYRPVALVHIPITVQVGTFPVVHKDFGHNMGAVGADLVVTNTSRSTLPNVRVTLDAADIDTGEGFRPALLEDGAVRLRLPLCWVGYKAPDISIDPLGHAACIVLNSLGIGSPYFGWNEPPTSLPYLIGDGRWRLTLRISADGYRSKDYVRELQVGPRIATTPPPVEWAAAQPD